MVSTTRRAALLLSVAGLAACAATPPPAPMLADPTGRADPEMLQLLQSLAALEPKPIETLAPAEARRQPTMADAVMRLQRERGLPTAPRPLPVVRNIVIPGPGGPLQARVYGPAPAATPGSGEAPLPLIVYFHGGGWVIADLDVYDASARALALETNAVVLAVRYRQGPEVKFPGAHDDAYAAYVWAVRNAAQLGADATRVAIAGESAGGNLAIATALSAKAARVTVPAALALIYPVAGTDIDTPSYAANLTAKPLNRAGIQWFVVNYTNGTTDLRDPRLNVYGAADLTGLPRTIIINAEIDPLLDDGARLEQRLRAAGVVAVRRVYPGVTHEFFGAAAVHPKAADAQRFVAAELRQVFAAGGMTVPPAGRGRPRG